MDDCLWNDWHVVAETSTLRAGRPLRTRLFGVPLSVTQEIDGGFRIHRDDGVPVRSEPKHGFVWACLGAPQRSIIAIPELEQSPKCVATAGAITVGSSAGRVIENFLDLAHLGYVHSGYLGAEPYTGVGDYEVTRTQDRVRATGCKVVQPMPGQSGTTWPTVEYSYTVERPYIAWFDKHDAAGVRFMIMYIFAQPVEEERTIAHTLLILMMEGRSAPEIRTGLQFIFLQDKPILENQLPRRLPIGAGCEIPVAADKMSIAYRRWLADLGITYGVTRTPFGAAA